MKNLLKKGLLTVGLFVGVAYADSRYPWEIEVAPEALQHMGSSLFTYAYMYEQKIVNFGDGQKHTSLEAVSHFQGSVMALIAVTNDMVGGLDEATLFAFPERQRLLEINDELEAMNSSEFSPDVGHRLAKVQKPRTADDQKYIDQRAAGARKFYALTNELSDIATRLITFKNKK